MRYPIGGLLTNPPTKILVNNTMDHTLINKNMDHTELSEIMSKSHSLPLLLLL